MTMKVPPPAQAPFFDAQAGAHIFTRYADVAALLATPRAHVPPMDLDVAVRLERRFPGRFPALAQWSDGMLIHVDGPRHAAARDRAKLILRQLQQGMTPAALDGFASAALLALPKGEAFAPEHLAAAFIDLHWCPMLHQEATEIDRLSTQAARYAADWLTITSLTGYDQRNRQIAGLMEDLLQPMADKPCPWSAGGYDAQDPAVLLHILSLANGTAKHTIRNILRHLAADPAEQQRLREDPARVPAFVEEALRLLAGLDFRDRIVGPEGIGDYDLEPGARLRLRFDSAARDPAAYADPLRFDPGRYLADQRPPPLLSFGGGAHLCLGRILARQQIAALIRVLIRDWHLQLAPAPEGPAADAQLMLCPRQG